ncbi:MAG: DNA polymerase domain-containing protein, partial [Candidatus Nanohaloarchaea archaeon]
GRQHIQDAIEEAEEEGFEVVYGDTDSLFLKGENVDDRIEDFLEDVNEELPEFMELELEGLFKRGFFTSTDSGEGAKKKYALMKPDGGMKITGFEQVRRDWSPIAKETQKEVLRKVLDEEVEEAAEVVKDTIERMKSGDVPVEKLRIYTQMKKKPENYESTAPHVEAAKKAKERGEEISPGDTVGYVITRGPGNISSRAELVKYAEDYDADYYIDNQIIPVSLRVLKVFGYTEGQLKGKGRQSGLGQFG